MANVSVKICGLKDQASVEAAVDAGARHLGFNFFAKSPRSVGIDLAAELASVVPVGVAKVALVVNADDPELDRIVRGVALDMLQLHGSESPERVAELRHRYGLPVMKAVGISGPDDLSAIDDYADAADQLLIDAKAPKGAVLPGGNGVQFDHRLIAGRKYWTVPWMLAGGLTPENVHEAIRLTGARQVDVASGVEITPGVKDADMMRAFVSAAQASVIPHL